MDKTLENTCKTCVNMHLPTCEDKGAFTRFIREIRSCISRGILDLGFATIATYTVQSDDEEYGGLGGKH
jgi:hypothetical protein